MKLTSQTWSATCLTPTFCPAKTMLRLILRSSSRCDRSGSRMAVIVQRVVEPLQAAVGWAERSRGRREPHPKRLVRTLAVVRSIKSSKRACCCSRLAAAGPVASFFRVRCIRSWRPFCSGWPGDALGSMPRRIHQTESGSGRRELGAGERNPVVRANGGGQAVSLKARSKTAKP